MDVLEKKQQYEAEYHLFKTILYFYHFTQYNLSIFIKYNLSRFIKYVLCYVKYICLVILYILFSYVKYICLLLGLQIILLFFCTIQINIRLIMGNQSTKDKQQSSNLFKNDKSEYNQLKDDIQKACKCSYKTRIIGFVACFGVGWLLSFIASIVYLANHNIVIFAVFFSIGQIINIIGSCFLATPIDQVKSMFVKARIWFSIAYLTSTIATLVLALTLPTNLRYIVLISLIVQIISYFFYTLSYIPFGRKILGKIIKVMAD